MRTRGLIILGIISVIITAAVAFLSIVAIESGSSVNFSILDLLFAPFNFVAFLWPVLVVCANCRSRNVRVIAKALTLSYYAWLALTSWKMFYGLFWELFFDAFMDTRSLLSNRGWALLLSSLLFAGLHGLIWIPSLFFVKNQEGRSPWLVLDSRKKHTLIVIGLGIVSLGLTLSALVLSGFIGTAGGNFSLLVILLGPFQVFVFAWPVLVVCANWRWRPVRLMAKLMTLAYYAWLVSFGWHAFSDVFFNFKYIFEQFGWFVPYIALLLASLQALIWLPSFFLVKKQTDASPPKGLPVASANP